MDKSVPLLLPYYYYYYYYYSYCLLFYSFAYISILSLYSYPIDLILYYHHTRSPTYTHVLHHSLSLHKLKTTLQNIYFGWMNGLNRFALILLMISAISHALSVSLNIYKRGYLFSILDWFCPWTRTIWWPLSTILQELDVAWEICHSSAKLARQICICHETLWGTLLCGCPILLS